MCILLILSKIFELRRFWLEEEPDMHKKILFLFAVILVLVSCSKTETPDEEKTDILEGIKISQAQPNEEGERVHNIYNYNTVEKRVRVTTVCYGRDYKVIDDSDTNVMLLEPESVSGWRPDCPDEADRIPHQHGSGSRRR